MTRVRAGDHVLHLRGVKPDAAFVGFSIAQSDCFETSERPPDPGEWGYADRYYRVLLQDFMSFTEPILLEDVFQSRGGDLRSYYIANDKKRGSERRKVFFVIQGGRLQCLNGAYLTEVDDELARILLGPQYSMGAAEPSPAIRIPTGESVRNLRARVGQRAFSENVRLNYGTRCCFPWCDVAEDLFLVGAHIARWGDVPGLRGEVSNGLCLCLMHDKAFETGLFTIDEDLRVAVNTEDGRTRNSQWCRLHLLPHDRQRIRLGKTRPTKEVLRHHWERVGFVPESQEGPT